MQKTIFFSILFMANISMCQRIDKSYSYDILSKGNQSNSINLIIFSNEKYSLFTEIYHAIDMIENISLSTGDILKKGDTLILKDCLYPVEYIYYIEGKLLYPIRTKCFLMDKPLVLNADNYFDNEFSEDWCKNETIHNKIKHIYDLKHKSEKSNYTFPVDTGTYYAATILPDGSFYSSSVSSPTLTLHQNHRYELKSDYDSLSYSKGRWVQKNRIITLHDECLNYEMFFTIEDDKKLYGTFPKHEENIDGDYFIHSKTVEKMNDW